MTRYCFTLFRVQWVRLKVKVGLSLRVGVEAGVSVK